MTDVIRSLGATTARAVMFVSLVVVAPIGCADTPLDGTETPDDGLQPPAEGEGVQFRMQTEIPAGTEAEHCLFVQAPADGLLVNRDEVRYSAGSHHFLLYETDYDEIPTAKDDGRPVDTSGVFDCTDGPTDGWSITKLVGGSQNADGDSMLAFPPDVAIRVRPGAVLLMNAHYLNASDQALEPEVRINLYTIPEADVAEEGDLLFLYNPLIVVPAGGESRARMRCTVHRDITIVNAQSHMHARGVGYAAAVEGQEPFYTTTAWEDVPVTEFADGGIQVPAGAVLDYHCDYQNGETRDVYQGPRSTDEMCMLIGSYYPADPAIANCLNADGSQLGGEYIGAGTATCAQTFDCIQAAVGQGGDPLPGITDCMMVADPAVSRESSDVLNCMASSFNPQVDCADQIAACQAK